jgi:hypothetical protein
MLQITSVLGVLASAYPSSVEIEKSSRKILPPMMLKPKIEALIFKAYLTARNFEGLILLHSLLLLKRVLASLKQDVRSCVLAPMEVNSDLETGFPIYILLCN